MIYSNSTDPLLKGLSAEYSQKNVHLTFAFKIKGDIITDERCVAFVVDNKLPLDKLSAEDILPSEIMVNGTRYPTDVIEIKDVTALLACPTQCTTWQTTPPGNRNTVRPLVGGLSIGAKNNITPTGCNVGTLGFIAVDRASQALVGVTNAHVVVKNAFYTMEQDLTKLVQNQRDNYVYQTGETCTVNPAIQIGQVIRYNPLYKVPTVDFNNPNVYVFPIFNVVDAALVSLKQSDVSNTESFKQYGLNYNLPLPFATSDELDNLYSTPKLYSSGRTSGARGEEPCSLGYYGTYRDVLAVNGYDLQGEDYAPWFTNFILFSASGGECVAVSGGDSGSALIADIGGVRKIVGLVFARALVNNIQMGLAVPIDMLAYQLGIEAWDGTPKNFIDPLSIEYTTVPGKSNDAAIKKDGKVYWQVGLTGPTTTTTTTII